MNQAAHIMRSRARALRRRAERTLAYVRAQRAGRADLPVRHGSGAAGSQFKNAAVPTA